MHPQDDPFISFGNETLVDEFGALQNKPMSSAVPAGASPSGVVLGRLMGFDLLEQPLVGDVPGFAGQVLAARGAVALRRAMLGRQVVLVFEQADQPVPIVLGVIEPHPLHDPQPAPVGASPAPLALEVDGDRRVIEAEREIVLRCGDASITLTRAGKVIIRGHYILSRSTGYNKIKGAAIDIN